MSARPETVALIEALLLVAERPLAVAELAEFLPDTGEDDVRDALEQLRRRHGAPDGGLQVEEVAGGFRLATRPELGEAVRAFFRLKNRQRLSRAALETLAIVAYRQPVTHPEIQEMRGVSAEGVLRHLLERRLLRIVGRKETVGKPLLYGTTRDFLEHFGLGSLEDLPPIEEMEEILGVGLPDDLERSAEEKADGNGAPLGEAADAPEEEVREALIEAAPPALPDDAG